MMKTILQNRLSALDAKYGGKRSATNKRLRVFYGWAKINKTRKKEAISIIFENERRKEEKVRSFVNKMQNTVYEREQTDDEKIGVEDAIRCFTEYSVFLSDKRFKGSLELALKSNSEADRNNVSEEERNLIADRLRQFFLDSHPDYKEPTVQLELDFN